MIRARALRHYDLVLLLACAGLIALGMLLLYSGTLSEYKGSAGASHPVVRQLAYAIFGAGLMVIVSLTDYRMLGRLMIPIYAGGLLMLASVFVLGDEILGSRRWLSFAGVQIQPSELMKLIVVLTLAKYLSDRRAQVRTVRVFLVSLAIALPPIALVLLQPDLGSAIVFGFIWLGMVIMAGANLRHVGVVIATVLIMLPFFFLVAIQGYQKDRIALFLNPESDPLGGGFNIIQAEIAIGSGGLLGKGLTEGIQTQSNFVQTQSTDYVFSVLGEEMGFLGAMLLFSLFIVFLFRSVRASSIARDGFGELVPVGIVVMVLTQVFINIGVNLRLLPVTGLPLPFISQGGSSLATLLIAVGIIQSIRLRHRGFEF